RGVPVGPGASVARKVGASKAVRREGFFVATAELRSTQPNGREALHARAEVMMVSRLPAAPAARAVPALAAYELSPGEAYQQGLVVHGPAVHAPARGDGC